MGIIITIVFWGGLIWFFVIRPKAKRKKEEKQCQLAALEWQYNTQKEKFNKYLSSKAYSDPESHALLQKMRTLNESIRRLGKDHSAEIDGLEQAWQQKKVKIANSARMKKETELKEAFKGNIKSFDLEKRVLLLYEDECENFRKYVDSLKSMRSILSDLEQGALALAKLDPPINVSAQLAQREVDCFDAHMFALLDSSRCLGVVEGEAEVNGGAAKPFVVSRYQESVCKGVEMLMQEASKRSQTLAAVNQAYDYSNRLTKWKTDYERAKTYLTKREKLSPHGMIIPHAYGQANKELLAAAQAMTRPKAETVLHQLEDAKQSRTLDSITGIDPQQIFTVLWFFAMEKPYHVADLKAAQDLCNWYFHQQSSDVRLAEWYAQRQMGGVDAVAHVEKKELEHVSAKMAEQWASGLMWLQAYKQEQKLLQGMLSSNMPMSAKAQERLHALNNGGGNAPGTHQAVSAGDQLFFDVSAPAWQEAEYNSLFESLAFQDKKLTYGLAVRDEDNDLLLPAGVSLPGKDEMLAKFRASLDEEYGDQAEARNVECVMLSGSGKENMAGVLVTCSECRQLGIVVNLVRIGKKVNIKFYTVFRPEGLALADQKQQAISLSKKMSPSVSMWENSLKSTILTAIQQMLNSSAQGGGQPMAESLVSGSEKPVF